MRSVSRWVIPVLLWSGLGASTVAAVEESQILAWAGAGEEVGATLACRGRGAVLGAPGSGGTGDRFFLAAFDPQTALWVSGDEVAAGNSFVALAMSNTNVAAVLDDAVEVFGSTPGELTLTPMGTVTGASPRAVAIDNALGSFLVVGRHINSFPVSYGVVSTYSRSGSSWVFEDSFQGPITYGWTLSMDRDVVAVGRRGSTTTTGQVSLLSRSPDAPYVWSASFDLKAPDEELENLFGAAIALNGDSWAVGAPLDDHAGGVDAGSVHLYHKPCDMNGFVPDGVLVSPDPVAGGRFGASVALVGRDLVVGEPGAGSPVVPLAGAAHLFRRGPGGWAYVETLTRSAANTGDELGTSVCISEYGVLVGAPFADPSGIDSGAVLFYAGLNTLFADGFECGDANYWSTIGF